MSHKILIDSQGDDMSMFTVQVTYSTPHSCGHRHDKGDVVDFFWRNGEKASHAVWLIGLHHRYFLSKRSDPERYRFSAGTRLDQLFEAAGEDHVPVEDDNGNIVRLKVFWNGYFDELLSVSMA